VNLDPNVQQPMLHDQMEQQTTSEDMAPIDRARAAETARPMDEPMRDDMASDVDVDVAVDQPIVDTSPQFSAIPDLDRNRENGLMSGIGTAVSIGGGVSNFTDDTARSLTSPGGEWNARAVVGTRSIVALEGAYEGSARNIDAAGLDTSSYLVSTGLEGALRLNAPVSIERGLVEPFVFGGLGWQNFNLAGDDTNTSSVEENDNVLTVPVGVGIAGGYGGLHLDGRFTYRYAVGSDMFGPTENGFDENSVSNWSLGAGLGFEF
jgi:hypothetical protein